MRIGIDLGGTKIEAVALDLSGIERFRKRVPTPAGDYQGTLNAIRELVEQAERSIGAACTVGLGAPGAISPFSGRVKNSNSTCLNDKPLREDLEAILKRQVRMENDANCFALSEATDGAARGAAIVFGVIIGTGTGGGIVVNGRVVCGPNAITGEWGHNPLPWPTDDERPGPSCYCGKSGCIETFLSGPGLERAYAEASGKRLAGPEIAKLADGGDAAAERVIARYEDRLARGLASIINVLDPHVIVLGGGVSNIERLYRTVPALWGRYVFSDRVATKLVKAVHGDSSGVRGAAHLW